MLSIASALRLSVLCFLVALGAFAYTDAKSQDLAGDIDKILAGEHRDPRMRRATDIVIRVRF